MINLMKQKGYPITSSKPHNIKTYCAEQGLMDASKHGVQRTIYFGTVNGNAMEYLKGNIGTLCPEIMSVKDISKQWYVKYVYPRCQDLIKRHAFMTEYDYDTYYVDNLGYNRNRKKASILKTKTGLRQREIERNVIIVIWFKNQEKTWKEISALIKNNITHPSITLDQRAISKYILQQDYSDIDPSILVEIKNHIQERDNLITTSEHQHKIFNIIDILVAQVRRFIVNMIKKPVRFILKKSRLYITSQNYQHINTFDSLSCIDNLKKGEWVVYPDFWDELQKPVSHIVSMRHNEYSFQSKLDEICEYLHIKSYNMIFKLGLTQTNKIFNLDDISILNTNIKITGKTNIFIDFTKTVCSDEFKILLYFADKTKTFIIGFDLFSVNPTHSNKMDNVM